MGWRAEDPADKWDLQGALPFGFFTGCERYAMGLTPEQRDWLRLTMVPGVGTTYFIQLLSRFHSPGQVLRASRAAIAEVVGKSLAERIAQYADAVDVDGQERQMDALGVRLLTLEDPDYPVRLAEIYDPPLLLFVRGELRSSDEHCIAIVGTRRATPYGLRVAENLGRDLAARGITVVSGMASGIDTAAHRGAIEVGGRTVAVLGCGVDVVYPPQNADLMKQIEEHGCVLSQFVMGTKPSAGHFPYRNRIISGLTLGTVVVEAPLSSGALITARQAAEQGREVFAVPGQIGFHTSEGPHSLIRDGAKLVETVDDILVELDLPAQARQPQATHDAPVTSVAASPPPQPVASPIEKDILAALSPNGTFVDEIATACRISISEALSTLTMLELRGLVRQFSGKRFAPT